MRSIAAFLLTFALAGSAGAATLADMDVPDTATVANAPLVLNGVGLRKKFFIKIYVGGLYLPAKSNDAAAIIAGTTPNRVLMHMLYDVTKEQFADAWHDDFKANNPQDYDALRDQVEQLIPARQHRRRGLPPCAHERVLRPQSADFLAQGRNARQILVRSDPWSIVQPSSGLAQL